MSANKVADELPEIVVDKKNGQRYRRGQFLGKGGFARCYELQDMQTNEVYAGKVVPKKLLQKQQQLEKMQMEISIHRMLSHRNIVNFISYFEDVENVYIILELCRRRSLLELHKRRKTVTGPEARYFLMQIVQAMKYLHDGHVIHRDLKLGNLFLNDDLDVKVGDFGLATRIERDGERKLTLCGTPNYIAPEVLKKLGHSFEVDSWAIGCILYTLLSGNPPFETLSLKETYERIKRNAYSITPQSPLAETPHAVELVRLLLAPDPQDRPSMADILAHPFFTGYIPAALPVSCLSNAPRFDTIPRTNKSDVPVAAVSPLARVMVRRPLDDVPSNGASAQPQFESQPKQKAAVNLLAGPAYVKSRDGVESSQRQNELPAALASPATNAETLRHIAAASRNAASSCSPSGIAACASISSEEENGGPTSPAINGLSSLQKQVRQCIAGAEKRLRSGAPAEEAIEDPACAPIFWVSTWVDYSDKYGLGYQLCDNSVGVLFNDSTRLLLASNAENIQYFERDGTEHLHTMHAMQSYPQKELRSKVTLLSYFRSYMNQKLQRAGGDQAPRESDGLTRLPFMNSWFRTQRVIVILLSNGTLQINFFDDHIKIILCPVMEAISVLDADHTLHTYRLALIRENGAPPGILQKLCYAQVMIAKLKTRVALKNLNPANGLAGRERQDKLESDAKPSSSGSANTSASVECASNSRPAVGKSPKNRR